MIPDPFSGVYRGLGHKTKFRVDIYVCKTSKKNSIVSCLKEVLSFQGVSILRGSNVLYIIAEYSYLSAMQQITTTNLG